MYGADSNKHCIRFSPECVNTGKIIGTGDFRLFAKRGGYFTVGTHGRINNYVRFHKKEKLVFLFFNFLINVYTHTDIRVLTGNLLVS